MAESTAFPWLKHLPEDHAREFFNELFNAFGEAQLDTMPGVAVNAATYAKYLDAVIAPWRSTAEVHADPELYAALTADHDVEEDFVEAPRQEWQGASADLVIVDEISRVERVREAAQRTAEVSKGLNERLAAPCLKPFRAPGWTPGGITYWCDRPKHGSGNHQSDSGIWWDEDRGDYGLVLKSSKGESNCE